MGLGGDLDLGSPTTTLDLGLLTAASSDEDHPAAALHVQLRDERRGHAIEPCDFDGGDARFELRVDRGADVVRVPVVRAAAGHGGFSAESEVDSRGVS